jgi:hypothetical protein
MENASPSPPNTKHVQVRPAQRNAAGEGQRAAMNVMRAVRLHEIGKAARTTDAGHGGDLLVPELALFDQLEVEREHGEIAATGAPRRVIGGDFFFGQAFAFVCGQVGSEHGGDVCAGFRRFLSFVSLMFKKLQFAQAFGHVVLARWRMSFTFQVRPSVLLMPRIFGSQ